MATIGTAIKLNDMMSAPIRNIVDGMNMMLSMWQDLEDATSSGLNVKDVESIRSKFNQATDALDQMGDEQREFNRYVDDGSSAVDGLADKIIGVVGAYAGLQGLQQLVNLSDSYTQTQSRLSMIVDMPTMPENISAMEEMAIRQEQVDILNDKIFASAQRARAKYQDMADTVAKLSLNAGDAFGSNDETILFAENLNKLFAIAGTEQASIASATLQLTQALGSGVLRGEEFNAVFEAAPNIMQTVADYMDVPIGKLRQLAQDGQITADVVKYALLNATDKIDTQFKGMDMTWAQVWNGVMNSLYHASIPILELINLFANNWSVLQPIVLGVATAVGLYTTALLIHKAAVAGAAFMEAFHAAQKAIKTGATLAEAAATTTATGAQVGFNAALLACPITWIIIAIITVIALIHAVVAAINKIQGTTISATGIIMGALAVAGAFIMNTVIGIINGIIQLVAAVADPILSVIEWILNATNGGFNSFGDACANLIGQIISWFLSLGKIVTKIIDAIFGTDWTSGLNATQEAVLSWGKNEDAITLNRNAPTINKRFEYSTAWDTGYDFGAGVEESIGNIFGGGLDDQYSMDNLTESIGNVPAFDEIASNTGDIKDSMEITSENLKYLRDLAEQDAVNRFTTAEVRVEMTNNNNISSSMDLDGVIDHMVTGVNEAMERVAEGVHN